MFPRPEIKKAAGQFARGFLRSMLYSFISAHPRQTGPVIKPVIIVIAA